MCPTKRTVELIIAEVKKVTVPFVKNKPAELLDDNPRPERRAIILSLWLGISKTPVTISRSKKNKIKFSQLLLKG